MKQMVLFFLVAAIVGFTASASGGETKRAVVGTEKVTPKVIPSLRAIAKYAEQQMANEPTDGMKTRPEFSNMTEEEEKYLRSLPSPTVSAPGRLTIDASAPAGPSGARTPNMVTGPTLSTNFEGNLQGGSRPGDPMLATGPHNVISVANSTVRIFSKTGTAQLTSSALTFLGANYGGFDPKVSYDIVANRFILLFDDVDNTSNPSWSKYYVAVSQSDDAMAGWYIYSFNMQYNGDSLTATWADFPGLGYDNNCIYMTGNMYSSTGFLYIKTRVVDKNAMYAGYPTDYADIIDVPGGGARFTLKPAQSLSPTNTGYLMINPNGGGSRVQVYSITGGPATPVMENIGNPTVSAYGIPPGGVQKDCAETTVDAGDARTQDPVWRDGYLYLANQVGVNIGGNVCAMRYYKIQTDPVTLITDETFGAAGTFYLYPAVTVDAAGTVYFSISRMSANEYASGAFTGKRLTDTAIQASAILKAGQSSYWCLLTGHRWGDYEGVSIDPAETSDTATAAWADGNWAKGPGVWGSWLGKIVFFYNTIEGYVYSDCDSNAASTGDRKPLAGVSVAISMSPSFTDTVTTDSTGKYTFGLLNDGTYDVSVIIPPASFALDAIPGTGGISQTRLSATELEVVVSGAPQSSVNNNFAIVVPHAFPSATALQPVTYSQGEPGFVLTVFGSNFEKCAFATFNGSPRATTWINDTTVQASILASDLVDTGSFTIRVINPPPAGGPSNGLTFTVHTPAPIFTGGPRSFDFGPLFVGSLAEDTITVTNDGTADLHIASVTSDNAEFGVSPASATIPRQTSLAFPVTYHPTLLGFQHGFIVFSHDAVSSPDTFVVTGRGLDSTMFRTATSFDWANAFDAKGKRKSYPRKPDKDTIQFTLSSPSDSTNGSHLTLTFSMTMKTFRLYVPPAYTDTLPYVSRTIDPKSKIWTYTLGGFIHPSEVLHGMGMGSMGKKIGVKYLWTNNALTFKAKGAVPDGISQWIRNDPLLPAPNLINVGEELFPKGFNQPSPFYSDANPLIIGIPTGPKFARSIRPKKYSDVLKSLVDSRTNTFHTHAPSCLLTYDNGSQITSQKNSLPPTKKNDELFAELLAFKLNIGASAAGKFPVGFGELTFYDSTSPGHPFNNMMLKNIAASLDSMLSCYDNILHDTAAAMNFLRQINSAFRDAENQKDTLSFLQKTILLGVKPLGTVPFLRKTPGITPLVYTSPNVVNDNLPQEYRLYQNYPNPFNPTTTIRFDLPEQGMVTLKVYNVLGQQVASLADNVALDAGEQEFEFDATRLASGVYFYRLTVQSAPDPDVPDQSGTTVRFRDVKKMLLMK